MQFPREHREPIKNNAQFGFETALALIKTGHRVARSGWNGKGMWLALVPEGDWSVKDSLVGGFKTLPFIGMKTAAGEFVPWLASQTDLLAYDWMRVE